MNKRNQIPRVLVGFLLCLTTACGGDKEAVNPAQVKAIFEYSDAVQKQSSNWSSLHGLWTELAQEKEVDSFKTTLSLHGTKQLRNYIDGISRITVSIPRLESAHRELVKAYRALDDGLIGFTEGLARIFREEPETARKKARDGLKILFDKMRRAESRYLRTIREVYSEHGIRLEANTSNRYEEPEAEEPLGSNSKEQGH